MSGGLGDAIEKRMSGTGKTTAEHENLKAEVEVRGSGPYAVEIKHLKINSLPGDISDRAEKIAANCRPGGEPLLPIEVDPGLGGAVLRTKPERIRDGRFYQIELDDTGLELTRQAVDKDGRRKQQSFTMTRDDFKTLVDDLANAVE